jgi:hypothetical protein
MNRFFSKEETQPINKNIQPSLTITGRALKTHNQNQLYPLIYKTNKQVT